MDKHYEVIIVGGSYAGLAAAMALGRALRKVLVVDGGKPANRFTPHSHNFITHDGRPPGEIAELAKGQVDAYNTITRISGFVTRAEKSDNGFVVGLEDGSTSKATKLIFATGIIDEFPALPGFADCWGKSVLHCPYCHGYEVRDERTGIVGNGDYAFEFGSLISNWTKDLTVFTNGVSTLTAAQSEKLSDHGIKIVESPIKAFIHERGQLSGIAFENGGVVPLSVIYTRPSFRQHSAAPAQLGCIFTPEGYLLVDPSQKTSVPGVYACGDNVTKIRTVANAVAMGTTAGMMVNKELIQEMF